MRYSGQIISGVIGTLMMSAFSSLLSRMFGQVFQEHKQLEKMIDRASPAGKITSRILGWSLHFLAGQIFSYYNIKAARQTGHKPNPVNSLLLGAADGIIGIIIWRIQFMLHPNPPKVNLTKYLIQLFFAHLVYGFFHGLIYQLVQKRM